MEFRICFSITKYENDIISLCETSNELIHGFCLSKVHFRHSGPLKLINLFALLYLSPVWNRYPKGSQTTSATKRSMIAYNEI